MALGYFHGQALGPVSKPMKLIWWLDDVVCRSAWNTAISYTLPCRSAPKSGWAVMAVAPVAFVGDPLARRLAL